MWLVYLPTYFCKPFIIRFNIRLVKIKKGFIRSRDFQRLYMYTHEYCIVLRRLVISAMEFFENRSFVTKYLSLTAFG